MPLWAILLMCFVVLAITTAGTTVFSALMFARRIVVDAYVPEKMQQAAMKIAQFPQPLPEGYKYLMAADFELMQCLVIEHKPSGQQIVFYTLPGPMTEKDAKNFLDRAYDAGINTVYLAAKFHSLKSHGSIDVNGAKLNFLLGEFTDLATNRKADGMVGSISLNKAAKNILIYSYPDAHHAYNQQVTLDLLNSLKGF